MRVLFYHEAPTWSGEARAFAAAGRGLLDRGFQVTYCCQSESEVHERLANAPYDVVPIEGDANWVGASSKLREILLDRFMEVVFVHTEREHLVAASALRRAERGAVVRRVPAGGKLIVGSSTKLAMRMATTGYLFTGRGELPPSPPSKSALEPVLSDVGVDVAEYENVPSMTLPDGDLRLITCVVDTESRARAATVLRTIAMLAPRHPELRLALVGQGANHEDLRMHAAALGITGIVSHLGDRDDTLSVLRASRLGWVVASMDNAAYGALDLMALRVPVLALRGSVAQRYIADGITGMVVTGDNAPQNAATVTRLLSSEPDRVAMGNAGRNRAMREFTEEQMVDGFFSAASAARDRTRWLQV